MVLAVELALNECKITEAFGFVPVNLQQSVNKSITIFRDVGPLLTIIHC